MGKLTKYTCLTTLMSLLVVVWLSVGQTDLYAQTIIEDGNVSVGALVPGPPPTTPATITTPINDQAFNYSPITVEGTCGADLIVKIFKNGVFAGSTVCESDGTFGLLIDLFLGVSELVAWNYDFMDQAGPASPSVVVQYGLPVANPVEPGAPSQPAPSASRPIFVPSDPSEQLVLRTDYVFKGLTPQKRFNWELEISGGMPPYAVTVDWGDGTSEVLTSAQTGSIKLSHEYRKSGIYKIVLRASDDSGQQAYLQLVAIVQNPGESVFDTVGSKEAPKGVFHAVGDFIKRHWALPLICVLFGGGYWLGLRRQKGQNQKSERR